MIAIRRARPGDAPAIAAVHVAAWRSAYPGLLPDAFLAGLSARRKAAEYERTIRDGGVFVAASATVPRIAGFVTVGRARRATPWGTLSRPDGPAPAPETPDARPQGRGPLGEGEIETLYVLDDWRDRGLGRRLIGAGAAHLAELGCRSAFCWVLRDNPSRWFYERIGGRAVMADSVLVAGVSVPQVAYAWDPIERLVAAFSAE
ncbi:MAG: GNAT family N-acetyltransferase [Janthinobacterium lividum]